MRKITSTDFAHIDLNQSNFTLREKYALAALPGVSQNLELAANQVASRCYRIAEAMLEQRYLVPDNFKHSEEEV